MANASSQLAAAAGATPIRRYVGAVDPVTWIGANNAPVSAYISAGLQYIADHNSLASLVATFDPLADDLQPGITPANNGSAALVTQRKTTATDWGSFAQAAGALYDGLITALGHSELASNKTPVLVPDTEISLFTNASGLWVNGILIQSPEPLPWQRIWNGFRLTSSDQTNNPLIVLWSADGTIGLLVPVNQARGRYNLSITFQGNIGAEAPCITQNGGAVTETVAVGSIILGPLFRRPIVGGGQEPIRPVADLPPKLRSLIRA